MEVLCYTVKEFEKKKQMIGLVQDAAKEGISIVADEIRISTGK